MSRDTETYDLGSNLYGDSRGAIDAQFTKAGQYNGHTCIICKQPASYRLIPKHNHLDTIEIQDKGFVCQGCIDVKAISHNDFGLRPLR